MPPKIAGKKKGISRCTHNNRGYCKLKQECKDKHFEEVCDNFDCDEDNCEKRHPNPCNFGPRCRFNKRKECMYMHENASSDGKLDALSKTFNNLENLVKKMEVDLGKKDSEIEHLNNRLSKIEESENQIDIAALEKDIEAKNAQINGLELRIDDLEKCVQTFRKQQEKKTRK